MKETEFLDDCSCRCHLGGAVSCPKCKSDHNNYEHGLECKYCKNN